MTELLSDEALAALVKSLAAERFKRTKVRDVTVERGFGYYGDPVVRIRVTTSKNPTGEATVLSELTRDIRERIMPDETFPVVSIMSAADAKWLDAQPD